MIKFGGRFGKCGETVKSDFRISKWKGQSQSSEGVTLNKL